MLGRVRIQINDEGLAERINYWLNQEDIYDELKDHEEFSDYTLEQCKQDLKQLVDWNNLMPMQDTKKVYSLESTMLERLRREVGKHG